MCIAEYKCWDEHIKFIYKSWVKDISVKYKTWILRPLGSNS